MSCRDIKFEFVLFSLPEPNFPQITRSPDYCSLFTSVQSIFTMGWFISFLYSQLFVTPPVPTEDFTGQTIIVTGSNTGLGLEAARHLSRLNASLVILAVRNLSKGASAKESILASTGRASNSIEVWELDMHSHNSLEEFAARVNKLPRLDAILENAGSMTKYFNIVAGYETTITTNVISTFLLALLILPKLRESAVKFNIQPRLSIVASDLHFLAKFTDRNAEDIFAALNDESSALSMER
jgi:retinol dehydrogenase-12